MNFFKRIFNDNLKATQTPAARASNTDSTKYLSAPRFQQRIYYTFDEQSIATAYHSIIAVNRSVELIANTINRLGYGIVTVDENGDDVVVASRDDKRARHPLMRAIIKHQEYYGTNFIQRCAYSAILYDEIYVHIVRNDEGVVRGFRWLNPLFVEPQVIQNEITHFRYFAQGESMIIAPDDMLYRHGLNSWDDNRGLSNILSGLDALNITRQSKVYVRAFFANGALPGVIFSPQDNEMGAGIDGGKARALRDQLRDFFQGVVNSHRGMVVEEPVNVTELDSPDLQKNYSVHNDNAKEIYQLMGVPLEMAGGTETRYKQGDDVYTFFMDSTIYPLSEFITDLMNSLLRLMDNRRDNVQFQFDQGVFNTFTEYDERIANNARADLSATIISINEARTQRGMKPIEGLDDVFIVQGVPVKQIDIPRYIELTRPPEPTTPPPPDDPPSQPQNEAPSERPLLEAQASTLVELPDENKFIEHQCDDSHTHEYPMRYWDDYTLAKARKEIKAWYNNTLSGKLQKREFEYIYTTGNPEYLMESARLRYEVDQDSTALLATRDSLLHAHTSQLDTLKRAWKQLLSNAHASGDIHTGVKNLSTIENEFNAELQQYIEELVASFEAEGENNLPTQIFIMQGLIREFAERAFREGLRESGVPIDTVPETEFNQMINEQVQYASEFVTRLFRTGEGENLVDKPESMVSKIIEWFVNSILPFYALAQAIGRGDPMMKFTGKDGNENCDTCKRLKNQVHRRSEWEKRGLNPSDDKNRANFDCGLWRCQHLIMQVNEPEKGDW